MDVLFGGGSVDGPKSVYDAIKAAPRFVKDIRVFANKKWINGAQMTVLIATKVMENVVLTVAAQMGVPGDTKGLGFISSVYDGAKTDALNRWNESKKP